MNLLAMTLDILKDLKQTLTLDVLYENKILNIFKIVKTGWLEYYCYTKCLLKVLPICENVEH